MTATDHPSDRAIAQAFDYECNSAQAVGCPESRMLDRIIDRARALDAAPADPVVSAGRSPQSIMMSAHAMCPSAITAHPARMRWMADYFMRELAR